MNAAPRPPMPRWLRAKLVSQGDLVGRFTAHPKVMACPGCCAPVAVCVDELIVGQLVCVDAAPITALGEWQALAYGRATYQGGRGGLFQRSDWMIQGNPAHSVNVFCQHYCGMPVEFTGLPGPFTKHRVIASADEPPPF